MRHRLHVAHRRARASYTRPEDDDTRRMLSGSANARKPVLLGLGPPFLLDGNQPHPHWPKPVSRSTAKGPVRQGGPQRTSFYLRKDARGLQRELHVNRGVTPTPHCTTWPTSATASLGQQRDTGTLSFILAHPPGGAPGNSVPPPPFHILANLPPSRPESPPNVGGRARHQSPGKGLISCSCASKPFQTISQPFTAPAPRRAKVSTGACTF